MPSAYETLYEKIKLLSIALFETERRCKFLEEEMARKDKVVSDLNADIYFSDLEVQELKQLVDASVDVNYMLSLKNQIADLDKAVTALSSMEITM
jgi:hypothetical protein